MSGKLPSESANKFALIMCTVIIVGTIIVMVAGIGLGAPGVGG